MSFNKFKKRKNNFNNLIKRILFGEGLQEKKIIYGKAKGIHLYIDPAYNFQRMIGAYEQETQELFVVFSKKCNCFFDIGASDGYYSLLYKKYNPIGEVYIFDADEKAAAIQNKHLALNNINSGYHLYSKLVCNKNDEEKISLDSFQIEQSEVLIKVDVEGGELTVLKGAGNFLAKNNCYLIIETHSHELEKDCIEFLRSNKYVSRIIKNAWWRIILRERRPLEHNRWLVAYKSNV